MQKIVLDTSVIIDHVRGKDQTLLKLIKLQKKKKVTLFIPSVVIFEFYSGLSLQKKEIREKTTLLFNQFKIVPLDEEIAKSAAEINRENRLYRKVSAADLIIAATALSLSALLATKNLKDFKLIPDLQFWPD